MGELAWIDDARPPNEQRSFAADVRPSDAEALDAYSRVVAEVAERLTPSSTYA